MSPLPSPDAPPAPWTPDQPLRHDATDEQIEDRYFTVSVSSETHRSVKVAREFAAACVAEVRRAHALPVGRALPSREQLGKLIAANIDLDWGAHNMTDLVDEEHESGDGELCPACLKVADAILASLTGGEPLQRA